MSKVFVSSTSRDLADVRVGVRTAISDMRAFTPVAMEHFGAREAPPIETCLAEVGGCDVFLGILGAYYGSSPSGLDDRSFTEREYDEAVRLGIPRLMHLTPEPADPAAMDPRQAAFRARVCERETAKMVSLMHPDRFATHAVTALSNLGAGEARQDWPTALVYVAVVALASSIIVSVGDRTGIAADLKSRNVAASFEFGMIAVFAALCIVHFYYARLLSTSSATAGSLARAPYERLRARLDPAVGIEYGYVVRLRSLLTRVDRFFQDEGRIDSGYLGRVVGLRNGGPTLTTASLDRCMALALVYPLLTMWVVWIGTGEVGPAEQALGIPPNTSFGQRSGVLVVMILVTFLFGMLNRRTNHGTIYLGLPLFVVTTLIAGRIIFNQNNLPTGTLAPFTVLLVSEAGGLVASIMTVWAIFPIVSMNTFATPMVLADFRYNYGSDTWGVTICALSLLVGVLTLWWHSSGKVVPIVLVPLVLPFVYVLTSATYPGWSISSPNLLFLALIPVVNLPFDWLALGTTRALLRRGVELRRWWPFILACADIVAALVLVALLTFTMALVVQLFGSLAVRQGAFPGIDLDRLFMRLETAPVAPELWWLYGTLFSTLIPSLINLGVGAFSVFRGLPQLASAIHRNMPAHGPVAPLPRFWLPIALTGQVVLGFVFGAAALAVMVWGVFFVALPFAGFNLLHITEALLDLRLPARFIDVVLPMLRGGR